MCLPHSRVMLGRSRSWLTRSPETTIVSLSTYSSVIRSSISLTPSERHEGTSRINYSFWIDSVGREFFSSRKDSPDSDRVFVNTSLGWLLPPISVVFCQRLISSQYLVKGANEATTAFLSLSNEEDNASGHFVSFMTNKT